MIKDINTHTIKVIDIITEFVRKESFGGILLFLTAFLAMLVANSPFAEEYFSFWKTPFGLAFGEYTLTLDMTHWVNDGLMALFFLMVGLEIKRELLVGELSEIRKASFPVVAAIGGMVIPALIYILLNNGTPSSDGFGVPMATDIAFALGVLMLLGERVPLQLKVFLVTLAVVDDLGAILVIAIFYSHGIDFFYLGLAGAVTVALGLMNYFGVKKLLPYLLLGVALWDFIHNSGIHATVAGVILAFTIPIRSKMSSFVFVQNIQNVAMHFCEAGACTKQKILLTKSQQNALEGIARAYDEVQNPLVRLEHYLHPLSAYLIMPIFAFANAGVSLQGGIDFSIDNVFTGIFFGLLLGKPIGVFLLTFAADKLGIARKPDDLSWLDILGAGMIAGIGFTMSIFIASLAFEEGTIALAKATILIASLAAGVLGALFFLLQKNRKAQA